MTQTQHIGFPTQTRFIRKHCYSFLVCGILFSLILIPSISQIHSTTPKSQSDPQNSLPFEAVKIDMVFSGSTEDLAFYNEYVFIANGDLGILCYDISILQHPVRVWEHYNSSSSYVHHVKIYNTTLFVVINRDIAVYDIQDPTAPQCLQILATFEFDVEHIHIRNNYLMISSYYQIKVFQMELDNAFKEISDITIDPDQASIPFPGITNFYMHSSCDVLFVFHHNYYTMHTLSEIDPQNTDYNYIEFPASSLMNFMYFENSAINSDILVYPNKSGGLLHINLTNPLNVTSSLNFPTLQFSETFFTVDQVCAITTDENQSRFLFTLSMTDLLESKLPKSSELGQIKSISSIQWTEDNFGICMKGQGFKIFSHTYFSNLSLQSNIDEVAGGILDFYLDGEGIAILTPTSFEIFSIHPGSHLTQQLHSYSLYPVFNSSISNARLEKFGDAYLIFYNSQIFFITPNQEDQLNLLDIFNPHLPIKDLFIHDSFLYVYGMNSSLEERAGTYENYIQSYVYIFSANNDHLQLETTLYLDSIYDEIFSAKSMWAHFTISQKRMYVSYSNYPLKIYDLQSLWGNSSESYLGQPIFVSRFESFETSGVDLVYYSEKELFFSFNVGQHNSIFLTDLAFLQTNTMYSIPDTVDVDSKPLVVGKHIIGPGDKALHVFQYSPECVIEYLGIIPVHVSYNSRLVIQEDYLFAEVANTLVIYYIEGISNMDETPEPKSVPVLWSHFLLPTFLGGIAVILTLHRNERVIST